MINLLIFCSTEVLGEHSLVCIIFKQFKQGDVIFNTCRLLIHQLELVVNLGWRNKERKEEQAVLLDLEIRFPKPPKASVTDNLVDTVCYAELIDEIRQKITLKDYRLLEHLSAEIYAIVKAKLPKRSLLHVRVTKYPKIIGLNGGVTCDYGDS